MFLAKLLFDLYILINNKLKIKLFDKIQKIFKRLLSSDTNVDFLNIDFITIVFC
jgi:hypothetical protein